MERTLTPELLDTLSPTHPDALRNRRDLRLTNAFMRNHAWFARVLPPLVQTGELAVEVGAGTGELGLRLARRGLAIDGLDLWPRPGRWSAARAWHQADLRTFGDWQRYPVVIGNLIFHQFGDDDLRALGRCLTRARVIVACEPMRRRASQVVYSLVAPWFRASHVTLHDAHVSIAAGFCDDELPRLLGLDPDEWDVHCTTNLIGAYRMIAIRRP
ncbi:MAG TPA: hypothetical protein VHE61_02850 [Opitutaceae bacterium]|nr:hypothetical protein [Opitutaceae bacterium]